jgi:6-phosphofructokinase 2
MVGDDARLDHMSRRPRVATSSDSDITEAPVPDVPPTSSYGARIVTVTMNPALDIATGTDVVMPTEKMRCDTARYDPGGGGINVARVGHALGAPVVAMFPAGGSSGDLVTELLDTAGLPLCRIRTTESTRESFTVDERGTRQQYRFVLPGPNLSAAEQEECLRQLGMLAASADYVVASGSLPPNVSPDFYDRIADVCAPLGVRLILDTSGSGLRHLTGGKVYLLKPSVRELRECVGRELRGEADQVAAARELIQRGCAENVLVSLGAEGALLITADGAQRHPAVEVPAGSGVGAGDAMVAAITVALLCGWPLDESIRLGIAAGAAMLTTPGTAACTRADVERLFDATPAPVELAELAADY